MRQRSMADNTFRCSLFNQDRLLSMKLLPAARMISATSMGGLFTAFDFSASDLRLPDPIYPVHPADSDKREDAATRTVFTGCAAPSAGPRRGRGCTDVRSDQRHDECNEETTSHAATVARSDASCNRPAAPSDLTSANSLDEVESLVWR